MNDGNIDFKNHYSIDSLAFGHCDYSFRNLGRPTKLQIRQEPEVFEVIIDDRLCFSSDKVCTQVPALVTYSDLYKKIRLPSDYTFGITAASAETPDSFEAYKFQLFTSQSTSREEPRREQPPSSQQQSQSQAPSHQSYDSQFEELHNRLQFIAHAVERLDTEMSKIHGDAEARHREVSRGLLTRDTLNEIASQSQKLDRVEKAVNSLQAQFSSLQVMMKDSHMSLAENIPKHMSNSKLASRHSEHT